MNKKAIFLLAIGMLISTNCVFGMDNLNKRLIEGTVEKKEQVNNDLKIERVSLIDKRLNAFCIPFYFAQILNHIIKIDPPFNFKVEFPYGKGGNEIKTAKYEANIEEDKTKIMDELEENFKGLIAIINEQIEKSNTTFTAKKEWLAFMVTAEMLVKAPSSDSVTEERLNQTKNDIKELEKGLLEIGRVLNLARKELDLYLEKKEKKAEGDEKKTSKNSQKVVCHE